MRLFAFILGPPVLARILGHIGEPVEAPAVLPALGECSWGDQSYKSETLLIVT
ncbi:MAG: hypothetical protein QNL91_01300 [Candidatus Krumholzibacteria bacterium]|nr:hypothetical protein [Candidatus Krumholzibacteria bacterium]